MNILSILHCSQSRDLGCQPKKSKDPIPKGRLEVNYDADCKIRDQNGQISPCAVHRHFQLHTIKKRKCTCGKRFPDEISDSTNFQIIINSQSIAKICDDEIMSRQQQRVSSFDYPFNALLGKFPLFVQADLVSFTFLNIFRQASKMYVLMKTAC